MIEACGFSLSDIAAGGEIWRKEWLRH